MGLFSDKSPEDYIEGLRRKDTVRNNPWFSPTITPDAADSLARAFTHQTKSARELEHEQRMAKMQAEAFERRNKQIKLDKLKEDYIKIRTNNILVTHESAVILAKQIYRDADKLTIEDLD